MNWFKKKNKRRPNYFWHMDSIEHEEYRDILSAAREWVAAREMIVQGAYNTASEPYNRLIRAELELTKMVKNVPLVLRTK